jgi:hypothetical protein
MGASAYARQPCGKGESSVINPEQEQNKMVGLRLSVEKIPLVLSKSSRDIAVGCSVSPIGTVKMQLLTCRHNINVQTNQTATQCTYPQ